MPFLIFDHFHTTDVAQRDFLAEWHFGTPNATPQGRLKISKVERIVPKHVKSKTTLLTLPKTRFSELPHGECIAFDLTCFGKYATLLVRSFDRTNTKDWIMKRMSRAGRQHQIHMVLLEVARKRGRVSVSTGFIARRMGIRSSTYLKNILLHMEAIGLIERLSTASNSKGGDAFRSWRVVERAQVPLPDHEIIINGRSCRMSEGL